MFEEKEAEGQQGGGWKNKERMRALESASMKINEKVEHHHVNDSEFESTKRKQNLFSMSP